MALFWASNLFVDVVAVCCLTTGEFVPLKEDDYIIRSEMHYVIESRKVSKDIKKLKERLKKGWAHSLSLSR